ncbi:MAG: SIR2 family protein [Acetobacteraceae bacterium]
MQQHGDAVGSASIVLTREQYRMLLPDGERRRALEALKTLLVTRPVLYLGFGLRDPDFLYLRDLLLNTFQGATRDHYAIMPDIRDDEADYWRRQYGIHLLGYQTHLRPDGSCDHRELLEMLVSLAVNGASMPHDPDAAPSRAIAETKPSDAVRVLALTRYTAGLLRLAPADKPIETRISSQTRSWGRFAHIGQFENWTTTRFLTEGLPRAILIGLPGAGKSFALRLATTHLAHVVQQACLDGTVDALNLALPVLIDLKLYQGDLRAQIEAALPAGFNLKDFLGKLRLKLFLDAFNEMPSRYSEDDSVFRALEGLRHELGDFDYVITSRTVDGLPTQDSPHYELARFDLDHVDRALAERGIVLSGHFEADVRWLLSRPFFLHPVTSGMVRVPEGARPGDVYESFLQNLQRDFNERFSVNLPLVTALSRVAYHALDNDREAFPLSWLTDQLVIIGDPLLGSTQDIVNWLIARNALIPYSGARVSFIHQSITEYCAALELVRLCEAGAFSLRDTVALKNGTSAFSWRWE